VGVLAPLLLHVLRLEPGEAVELGAGELHAYLRGAGVEVMGNSDNVLRGGLTPKHVDVAELLRVLRFEGGPPRVLRPVARNGPGANGVEAVYETRAEEFVLSVVHVREGAPFEVPAVRSLELLLCVEGEGLLRDGNETRRLRQGHAFCVPAVSGRYRLEGAATVFRARSLP